MTDVRKVITSLVPRSQTNQTAGAPRNQHKTPESDKTVNYNSNGFLELSNPIVYCPRNIVTVPDLATARTYSYESILQGGYLDGAINPVHPSVISPYRSFLIFGGGAPATWTFPDLLEIISYMRGAFPNMLISGLSWTFTIVNDTANALTLTVPAPATTGSISRLGFSGGGLSHIVAARTATRLTIDIGSAEPANEGISYIAH